MDLRHNTAIMIGTHRPTLHFSSMLNMLYSFKKANNPACELEM